MNKGEGKEMMYARSMPDSYAGLLEYTQDLLAPDCNVGTITYGQVRLLVEHLESVCDEDIESARYYGIGLIICGMAQQFKKPSTRENYMAWATQWTADGLIRDRYELGEGYEPHDDLNGKAVDLRLRADDVYSGLLSGHLIALSARNHVDYPDLLLTNALTFVSAIRGGHFDGLDDLLEAGCEKDIEETEKEFVGNIIEGDYATEALGKNTVSATLAVIRAGLTAKRRYEQSSGVELSEEDISNPVFNGEEIRQMRISGIAARFATLHLSQFNSSNREDGTSKLIGTADNGELVFLKDNIAECVPEGDGDDSPGIIHETTLKCPALHVPGMLRLVQEIVPEIAERVEEVMPRRLSLFGIEPNNSFSNQKSTSDC